MIKDQDIPVVSIYDRCRSRSYDTSLLQPSRHCISDKGYLITSSRNPFKTNSFKVPLERKGANKRLETSAKNRLEKLVEFISDTLAHKTENKYSFTFHPENCSWNFQLEVDRDADSWDNDTVKLFEPFEIHIECHEVRRDEEIKRKKSSNEIKDFDLEKRTSSNYYSIELELLLEKDVISKDSKKLAQVKFCDVGFAIQRSLIRMDMPKFPEGSQGILFRKVYQLNERLNAGASAVVCRGTHRLTQRKVAIKCVLRSKLSPSEDVSILREVEVLSALKHKYICPLIDFFPEEECYFIVMELMFGGDLFERIGRKKSYTERDVRSLCVKLLKAISHCHQHNIAHSDIKPKNLLLASNDDDSLIKLADFGFADHLYGPNCLSKRCGTPFFIAPEILLSKSYDEKADMWGVGVMIFLLFSGQLPFMGANQRELCKAIISGKYEFDSAWDDVSEDGKNLVRSLLVVDPEERLSSEEALADGWFRIGMRSKNLKQLTGTSSRLKFFNARFKFKSVIYAINAITSLTSMVNRRTENDD